MITSDNEPALHPLLFSLGMIRGGGCRTESIGLVRGGPRGVGGRPPDLADGGQGGGVQGMALEPDPGEAAAAAAGQRWRGGE